MRARIDTGNDTTMVFDVRLEQLLREVALLTKVGGEYKDAPKK